MCKLLGFRHPPQGISAMIEVVVELPSTNTCQCPPLHRVAKRVVVMASFSEACRASQGPLKYGILVTRKLVFVLQCIHLGTFKK